MTNQTFFNATFIARKARVLRNGEVPIILRITIAGQRAELNMYGQSYSQSIHKWLRKVRSSIPTR